MGWAWHKLYPTEEEYLAFCPDDFVCPSCDGPCPSGTVCFGYCPGGGGFGLCQLETCVVVEGSVTCNWPPTGGSPFNSGGDRRYRRPVPRMQQIGLSNHGGAFANPGMLCIFPNSLTDANGDPLSINPCAYEENSSGTPYYYATPNSPTSPPATIRRRPVGFLAWHRAVPGRQQIISAFNRYRYAGYMAHGANCDGEYSMVRVGSRGTNAENAQNLMVGSLSGGDIPYGVTGISGMENSLGRQFPLPDDVLTWPLFGGSTAAYGGYSTCLGPDDANPDWEVGHYAPNPFGYTGAQKGSFSFQCFNAHSYYNDNNSYGVVGIPTCSVWSLLHAIYYKIHADLLTFNGGSLDPTVINAKIKPDWWKTVDPAGISSDGTQMVRWVVNRFAEGVAAQGYTDSTSGDFGGNFVIPNIFLWEELAFPTASISDRWKYLFVIGNANILQDTSCTAQSYYVPGVGGVDPNDDQGSNFPGSGGYRRIPGSGHHHYMLDEVSHGPTAHVRLYSGPIENNQTYIGTRYQNKLARALLTPSCDPSGGQILGQAPGFEREGGHTANYNTYEGMGAHHPKPLECSPLLNDGSGDPYYCRATLFANFDYGGAAYDELPFVSKLCPEITTYYGHLDANGAPKDGCDKTKN